MVLTVEVGSRWFCRDCYAKITGKAWQFGHVCEECHEVVREVMLGANNIQICKSCFQRMAAPSGQVSLPSPVDPRTASIDRCNFAANLAFLFAIVALVGLVSSGILDVVDYNSTPAEVIAKSIGAGVAFIGAIALFILGALAKILAELRHLRLDKPPEDARVSDDNQAASENAVNPRGR
jgi:hypothetical protein